MTQQVPASISKLYELLGSGQFEIPHTPEAEAAVVAWTQQQLGGPEMLFRFAFHEAQKEGVLAVRLARDPDGLFWTLEHPSGACWARLAPSREAAWIQALISYWRTLIWRARVANALAVHVARGERVA